MSTKRLTTEFLVRTLADFGLLTDAQAARVRVQAEGAAARIRRSRAQEGRRDDGPDAEPATIVADFRFSLPDGAILDEAQIVEVLARSVGRRFERIDTLRLDAKLISSLVTRPYARRRRVMPARVAGDTVEVYTTDPFADEVFDELKRSLGKRIEPVLVTPADLSAAIVQVFGFQQAVARAGREIAPESPLYNLEALFSLKTAKELENDDQHVVNAVDYLLRYAFGARASDIHIEPRRNEAAVRLRIDGVLHTVYAMPKAVHPALVNRIKAISRLDVAERRRPQDGRMKTAIPDALGRPRDVEIRISTVPTTFGEKCVLRLLDQTVLAQDLGALGFFSDQLADFERVLSARDGIVLVTGPTGAGKTTTLYSALKRLAKPTVNVTTIEDPIEMIVEGFNQIAVQRRIELDFAQALRHVLRQDPDVIMVGEIRDAETADMAVQAALTGHLVFSTLHTNDAVGAITRLVELQVRPPLIAQTLRGVLAQRLLRVVCPKCAVPAWIGEAELRPLDVTLPEGVRRVPVRMGEGCLDCRWVGLKGRTGVYELLVVGDRVRRTLERTVDAGEIAKVARQEGLLTLRDSAVRLLAEGRTSYDEVCRVLAVRG